MTVDEVVAPLADAFAELTRDGAPTALVVRRGDDVVVDLAAGHDAPGRPFTAATPVFLYSAVKPYTALTALLAVADGGLVLDAPVAAVWPAFDARGKDEVTVAQALAHGAAVPGWSPPVTVDRLAETEAAAELLAAASPWWTPTEPGEHAVSYGHLVDGILRHGTGRGVASWWPDVRRATGVAIDLVAGSDAREPAPLDDPGGAWRDGWLAAPEHMGELLRHPAELLDVAWVNGPAGRRLVAPAVTGYGSAHDLAHLWSWWSGPRGRSTLGASLHARSLGAEVTGHDHVIDADVRWGLGPQIDDDGYGMGGVGGCVGYHDRRLGLSFGFTTPRVGPLDRLDPLDDALAQLPR